MATAVLVALGLLVAVLAPATASAAGASADLYVLVYAPNDPVPVGLDLTVQASVYTSGPDKAVGVTTEFTVTNAELISAARPPYVEGPTVQCANDTPSRITCSVGAIDPLADVPYAVIDAVVRPNGPGAIEVSANVHSTTDDPDSSNNSAAGSVTVVQEPDATLSGSVTYNPPECAAYGSNPLAGIRVNGALTLADGSSAEYEAVEAWIRPTGTTAFTQAESAQAQADGSFVVLLCGHAPTSFTVQLRHVATLVGGAAVKDLVVTARPTSVSATVDLGTLVYGKRVTVKGELRSATTGQVLTTSEAVVKLQGRKRGSTGAWAFVSYVEPIKGKISATASPSGNYEYRFAYPGDGPGAGAAVSAPVGVYVRPKVAVAMSPTVVTPGGTATITTVVRPGESAQPVTLQRWTGSAWTTVQAKKLSSSSTATWTLAKVAKGKHSYRIARAAGAARISGTSGSISVTATMKGRGNSGAYHFIQRYRGKPVRWNPCRVIHYRVNPAHAPKGALADTKEAWRRISQATGLRFHYDGSTKFQPVFTRGRQPAAVVIAWQPAAKFGQHSGGAAGVASPSMIVTQGRARIYKATVALNASLTFPAGFGRGATEGQLLMHEFGHVVGLDHTSSAHQIMQPIMSDEPYTMYGAGDLRGLRLLGRSQGCL